MDKQIIKIDDKTATIETTVVNEEKVNIDQVMYDLDSLIRTQKDNTQWAIDKNAKIQILIDEKNDLIKQLTDLGLKPEPAIAVDPLVQKDPNEIITP